MVIGAFFFALGSVGLALLTLSVINGATYRRGRRAMACELASFLDDAAAPSKDQGTGYWHGMRVHIAVNLHAIDFTVELPHAIVPYGVLLDRRPELAERMRALELRVEGDRLLGSVAREAGLAESLISVEQRIEVAEELRRGASFTARARGSLHPVGREFAV